MQAPKKPRIVFLIIASVLSAAIAWGFFMDPIMVAGLNALDLPIPRLTLSDLDFSSLMGGGEEQTSPRPDEEETKKSWWDAMLEGIQPGMPDDIPPVDSYIPDVEDHPPTDTVEVVTDEPYFGWDEPAWKHDYYTEQEMSDMFYDSLVNALVYLAAQEEFGLIQPIEGVGLFDLDVNGVPEIITFSHDSYGYAQYSSYDIYNAAGLSSWVLEGSQYEELMLWRSYTYAAKDSTYPPSSASSSVLYPIRFRSIIMYDVNGGSNCVGEIDSQFIYEERFVEDVYASAAGVYRVDGAPVDAKTYYEAYEQFKEQNEPLTDTAMVSVAWTPSRPERMAKMLVTSEQQFLNMGK